jgi:hypothetical protein
VNSGGRTGLGGAAGVALLAGGAAGGVNSGGRTGLGGAAGRSAGGVNSGRAGLAVPVGLSHGSLASILCWGDGSAFGSAGGAIFGSPCGAIFGSPCGAIFGSPCGSTFASGRSIWRDAAGGGAGFGSSSITLGAGLLMGMAVPRSAFEDGAGAGAGPLDRRSPGCKAPSFSSSGRENANSKALTSVRIFPPSRT